MNRKTSGILKRVLAGSLAVTTAFAFGGCGKNETTESNGKIAVICKAQGVSFWDHVKMGAEDAGEELGYEIIYNCAAKESSVDEQIGYINQAIAEGVKAIVIAPNSATELNVALKKASSQGIKVITVNSDVQDLDDERVSCIASDNVVCGNIAARQVALKMSTSTNKTHKIGIVGHGATSTTSLERIEGFTEEMETLVFKTWRKAVAEAGEEVYQALPDELKVIYDENALPSDPNAAAQAKKAIMGLAQVSILPAVQCDNDRETAKKLAADLIKNNSDLDFLFGTNTNSTLGICDAVHEAGKDEIIKVVGFNSDDAEIEYLRLQTVSGLVVQAPYNMGYLGVRYADRSINGDSVPKMVDTGATYVTFDVLERSDVKLLLDPRSAL